MEIDKIIVIILGIAGIGLTYWFFLMKKEKIFEASTSVDIVVEGGYAPEVISVKRGVETTINFLRKDDNSCLEEVVLPDFRIRKLLPLGQAVSIKINPERAGEYKFSCGMNMFHGKILVKD